MLNYNHVYYFHVVALEGSIARAAQRLGVTQPTVSEQIRQLERSLGVTLFARTATGLRLTSSPTDRRPAKSYRFSRSRCIGISWSRLGPIHALPPRRAVFPLGHPARIARSRRAMGSERR